MKKIEPEYHKFYSRFEPKNEQNMNAEPRGFKEPLNQILFGPPGTGKTYSTKELAVEIANPSFKYDSASELTFREQRNIEYRKLLPQ